MYFIWTNRELNEKKNVLHSIQKQKASGQQVEPLILFGWQKTNHFKYKMKEQRELDFLYKMKLQYFLNDTTIQQYSGTIYI